MPYVLLHNYFPELAGRETRSVTVPPGSPLGLPPGEYGFLETYCDEPGCDCRRVMFTQKALPDVPRENRQLQATQETQAEETRIGRVLSPEDHSHRRRQTATNSRAQPSTSWAFASISRTFG
jgi:hypothetical protein